MHRRTNGLWYSAEYSTFSISDEAGKYRLTVAAYSGDAGNAMMETPPENIFDSNGKMFSTPDSDNDEWTAIGGSCAAQQGSGWWFGWCSRSMLNCDTAGLWTFSVRTSHMLVKLY